MTTPMTNLSETAEEGKPADEEISSRLILELLEDLEETTEARWLEVIWGDSGSVGGGG